MEINTRMKKYHHYLTLLSLFMLLGILKLQAAIQLPAIFSNHMVLQRNSELTFWGWGIPGETISIAPEWMKGEIIKTQVNNTGKWSARVPSGEAGGPYEIRFSGSSEVTLTDVMLGEVWLCSGQSNMEWSANHGIKNGDEETANAHCPNLRIFHVARIAAPFPQENCFSQWTQCTPETMRSTSALAYFFGRNIQEELDVPVGIIVAAWGGTTAETWTPRECVMSDPVLCDYPYESNPWFPAETGTLYNSMIYPVMPYGIAGCIWYQGEANQGRASSYARVMQRLIGSWRTGFNKEFPFYLVQIAPFQYHSKDNGPALLREQQAMLPEMLDKVKMITVSDLVDNVQDIHPRDKRSVGKRLANLALDDTYHIYAGPYKSPVFESAYRKGNHVTISFKDIKNGLAVHGKRIEGLMMAAAGQEWQEARARIDGGKLIVPVKGIESPVSIRYCFSDAAQGNLFSTEGIPLAPFRADSIASSENIPVSTDSALEESFEFSPKFSTGNANPLLDFQYMADPTAVVHDGRIYVYGTNDHQQYDVVGRNGKNTYQHIHSLTMVSSDDMVNWTYHGVINVKALAPWGMASWAPSIASRKEADGKTHFYLYYSNSGSGVGMLTATSPVGPWTDPLGKCVVDGNTPGLGKCKAPFDPGVVIDDKGIGWLSFGGGDSDDYIPGDARIVRLANDMKTLDSEIVEIKAPYHFEANELNYLNGTWIYTYNTNWKNRDAWPHKDIDKPSRCCMSYMTSRTPLETDSWTYRDNYFKNPGDYGMSDSNNHTHLVKFQGKYYLFYHSLGLQDSRDLKVGVRSICVEEIEVNEKDLTIHMGTATAKGVSQIKPLDPFAQQQAETTAATRGVAFEPTGQTGNMSAVGNKSGQAICVRGAEFPQSPQAIQMKIKGKGSIEIHMDSPDGPLLSTLTFDTDTWQTLTKPLDKQIKGKHDIYFVFGNGKFLFDEWKFTK